MTDPATRHARARVAAALGAGWLGSLPIAACLSIAAGGFSETVDDLELAGLTGLVCALGVGLLGVTTLLVARGLGGRSEPHDVVAPLTLDHDDPVGVALRLRRSWLTAASAIAVVVPIAVMLVAPYGPSGRYRTRPATPADQVPGRLWLVLVVVLGAAAVVAVAIRAARSAEKRALAALADAVVTDDTPAAEVLDVVRTLTPAVQVRAGAAAVGAGVLVVVGALLAPALGPTGLAALVAVAVTGQVLSLRGAAAGVAAAGALRRGLEDP